MSIANSPCYTIFTMTELVPFTWLLTLIWFLLYWIVGGVVFAVLTILRLGRVRKVQFSCLFSWLAGAAAIVTARAGMRSAARDVLFCLRDAHTRAEEITAVFGCGFVGIFGWFLAGLVVVLGIGYLLLVLSQTKTRAWTEPKKEGIDDETFL